MFLSKAFTISENKKTKQKGTYLFAYFSGGSPVLLSPDMYRAYKNLYEIIKK